MNSNRVITICFFVIYICLSLLSSPTLYSVENGFINYTLNGGFGFEPTYYTHYKHIIHPFIGILFAKLSQASNSVNWYILLSIVFNAASWSIVLSIILKRSSLLLTKLLFLAVFFLFTPVFLLHIEFSYTAILLSIASIFILLHHQTSTGYRWVLSLLILGIALCFRMHVIIPILGTASFWILFGNSKISFKGIAFLTSFVLLWIALVNSQKAFFLNIDKNWNQEEEYRQALYSIYNKKTPTDTVLLKKYNLNNELSLVRQGLFIDSNYLSKDKFKEIAYLRSLYRASFTKNDTNHLKWLFLNNKYYFLSFFCIVLLLAFSKVNIRNSIIGLAIFTAGSISLYFLGKIPPYFLPTGLLLLSFYGIWDLRNNKISNNTIYIALLVLTASISILGGIRFYRENEKSKSTVAQFLVIKKFLSANPNNLYFFSGVAPIQNAPALVSPKEILLHNYIDSEVLLNGEYPRILKRYNISNISELPTHSNIFFIGNPPLPLIEYFKKVHNNDIEIVEIGEVAGIHKIFKIGKKAELNALHCCP